VRIFKLPATLIAAFRWHQTRQEAERKVMEGKWKNIANEEEDYVFVAAKSGGPLDSGQIYTAFQRAAKLISLEGFSPHSLRHSAAIEKHRKTGGSAL
jgi:integrase